MPDGIGRQPLDPAQELLPIGLVDNQAIGNIDQGEVRGIAPAGVFIPNIEHLACVLQPVGGHTGGLGDSQPRLLHLRGDARA